MDHTVEPLKSSLPIRKNNMVQTNTPMSRTSIGPMPAMMEGAWDEKREFDALVGWKPCPSHMGSLSLKSVSATKKGPLVDYSIQPSPNLVGSPMRLINPNKYLSFHSNHPVSLRRAGPGLLGLSPRRSPLVLDVSSHRLVQSFPKTNVNQTYLNPFVFQDVHVFHTNSLKTHDSMTPSHLCFGLQAIRLLNGQAFPILPDGPVAIIFQIEEDFFRTLFQHLHMKDLFPNQAPQFSGDIRKPRKAQTGSQPTG